MLRNRWADRGQAHASTRHGEANDEEAELGVLFRNAEVARFALDSLLEEDGFEPSFPPRKRRPWRGGPRRTIVVSQDDLCVMIRSSLSVPAGNSREPLSARAGPVVRIRFPPAMSQVQTRAGRPPVP
jgi:hypothetical protein